MRAPEEDNEPPSKAWGKGKKSAGRSPSSETVRERTKTGTWRERSLKTATEREARSPEIRSNPNSACCAPSILGRPLSKTSAGKPSNWLSAVSRSSDTACERAGGAPALVLTAQCREMWYATSTRG